MEAIDELNGDPSMIRNGQLPKGKASDLDDATISEISEKIERTTVRLKVKELHEEREKILEEMIIFQKRLTKKFFDEEIDKLLSTTREPEKRVIKELRKAEEFAI